MGEIPGLFLEFLRQFAGGPGAPENNLVRFGLAAVFWGILLVVAWSRQRHEDRPREKLLVWGFGLALFRELLMLVSTTNHILNPTTHDQLCVILEPIEHALGLASIVMIAGSFLRYILDDARLARRYLQVGLGAAALGYVVTVLWWYRHLEVNPGVRFHGTWPAWLMHLLACIFIATAMFILIRNRGWLRNVLLVALSFLFLSQFLLLLNYVTNWQYSFVLCPIANSFHIWAAPLFGFVYFREQSIEKKQAEDELRAYRDHLEELVADRTTELTDANEQLQREIKERRQAQAETARRNAELAAQNAIAATISRSLDLDTILGAALDTALAVLEMESGCIYLVHPDNGSLAPTVAQGRTASGAWMEDESQQRVCQNLASRAVTTMAPVLVNALESPERNRADSAAEDQHQLLVSTPLISHGRAVGALAMVALHVEEIAPQEIDLLTAIGQQIGMAVENARLYQETQRWASGMALLHEVSVFLGSTFDAAEIYDQIAQQSAQLIGCPAAHLFLWEEGQQVAVQVSGYGVDGRGAAGLRLQVDESPILPELLIEHQPVAVE
ncbi:MAG TPA: GAF domain-containing protein, partial [Anaerolineae bacterium]|nr:GAF domain-containing protein [Anaerolineae bacterium]